MDSYLRCAPEPGGSGGGRHPGVPTYEHGILRCLPGGIPNTPSLGQPTDKKHRTLLSAVYGSHEIEVRRSYGLTELIVDGKVYGREEGVVESGYTISARVGGHAIETEFTPGGKQLLRVDGQVIAKKQRLF